MYSTVIFDLDGTLLDTLRDLATAGNRTLAALGFVPHPDAAYRLMVGNGIPTLVRRILPQDKRSEHTLSLAASLFDGYYGANMTRFTAPYPGVRAMLARLAEGGVRMAVASNKQPQFSRPIVESFFPAVFEAVGGPGEGVPPKPAPEMVLRVLSQLGADPRRTLYVGDSDVDIHTAHAASLRACGVLWGFRAQAELERAGADFLAADAEELTRIILS